MLFCLLIPFLLQTCLMSFDECLFHRKRDLPRWERIGHPLDTFSVLAVYGLLMLFPFSKDMLAWFIGLGILSCLFITKDEFVHKHHCCASEQWLHAVLFVNHPILLASLGILWPIFHDQLPFSWMQGLSFDPFWVRFCFISEACMIFGFLLYQIFYWNFSWKKQSP